jgi:phosphoglycolate phosphatase
VSALRLVVFDCDGTLVDSQAAIGLSMANAFKDIGQLYPGDQVVKQIVGLSLRDAALILLPEDQHDLAPALEAGYRKAFSTLRLNDQVFEPLYPGVRETLEALREENILMGVATGKGRKGLEKTLAGHGISEFFDTLQTADFHPGKPNPSMLFSAMEETGVTPEMTLFVGDTTFDVEMGKSAGVKTLGVSWGYHEPRLLEETGASAILEGMDEVVHHALRLARL